jgi:hypothetical protein
LFLYFFFDFFFFSRKSFQLDHGKKWAKNSRLLKLLCHGTKL